MPLRPSSPSPTGQHALDLRTGLGPPFGLNPPRWKTLGPKYRGRGVHPRHTLLALAASLLLTTAATAQPAPQQAAHPVAQPTPGYLLVVTKQSHALALIDGQTLQTVARIPIGEDPHEVTIAPDNRTALVSNYGEATLQTIQRLDLPTRTQLLPLSIAPLRGDHGLWVHGSTLWFTAEASKALCTLELGNTALGSPLTGQPSTNQVASVLGTGQDKTHLVWVSQDGNRVVASNAGSGTLSVFDRVTYTPTHVAGAPALPAAYAQSAGWRHTLVPTGPAAEGFTVTPDERQAWVGDDRGTLHIIDLASARQIATMETGAPGTNRLRFTPDGKTLLVTTHTGTDLLLIDPATRTRTRSIPIELHGASAIQLDPAGTRAFISAPRDHFVAVVDLRTGTRTATVNAGREPDGLAWWTP